MYDDDAPAFRQLGDRQSTARKAYPCGACPHPGPRDGRTIPPGQRYRRIVALHDFQLWVHRECVGPCPHAAECEACGGTGEAAGAADYRDYCRPCEGTGKVRRATQAP